MTNWAQLVNRPAINGDFAMKNAGLRGGQRHLSHIWIIIALNHLLTPELVSLNLDNNFGQGNKSYKGGITNIILLTHV